MWLAEQQIFDNEQNYDLKFECEYVCVCVCVCVWCVCVWCVCVNMIFLFRVLLCWNKWKPPEALNSILWGISRLEPD